MAVLAVAYVKLKLDTSGIPGDIDRAFKGRGGEKPAKDKGDTLGKSFSEGMAGRINRTLSDLKLPPIDLKADPADALAGIRETKVRLGELSRDGATVEIRVDAQKAMGDIGRFEKQLDASAGPAADRSGRKAGDSFAKGFGDRGSTFARVAAIAAARATLFGASAAAAAPGLIHLTGAILPAVGIIGAMPAAFGAAAAAIATFKFAAGGVGAAISKGLAGGGDAYEKALDQLTPMQRAFTKEVVATGAAFDVVKESAAQNLFGPLIGQVRPLADAYIPTLTVRAGEMAGVMGRLGGQLATTFASARTVDVVSRLFDKTRIAIEGAGHAVQPMTQAIVTLLNVTLERIPGMGVAFGNVALKAAQWIEKASMTGRINDMIDDAIATLRILGQILGNLGSIVASVFGAAQQTSGNLLVNFRELTALAARFLRVGEGRAALTDIFQTLSVLGQAIRTSLGAVLPAVAQSISTIAPTLRELAPVASQLVVALAPLLPYFVELSNAILRLAIPALAAVAGWLERNQAAAKILATVFGGLVLAVKLHGAAMAAAAAYTRINTIATAENGVVQRVWNSTFGVRVRLLAADAAAWVRSTAATVASTVATTASAVAARAQTTATALMAAAQNGAAVAWVRTTAATVAGTAAQVAGRVATIAGTVATGAAAVATTALGVAWRFLTGPLGIIITVLGLVSAAVIYLWRNNETFRKVVLAVWAAVLSFLKGVQAWWTNTFVPLLKRGIDFIVAYYRFLWSVIKVVWEGIAATIKFYWAIIMAVFNAVKTFVTVTLPNAFRAFVTAVKARWNELKTGLQIIWAAIKAAVFTPLVTLITQTIPARFRSGIAAIGSAWAKLQALARTPVAFVVNHVINPLIGGWNTIAAVFGAPKASTIKGFATGGRIPGAPSRRDNILAEMTDPRGRTVAPLKVATGEYIVNSESTAKWLPVLEAINGEGRRVRKPQGVDPRLDGLEGFAGGGLIGWAKSLLGKAAKATSKVFAAVADPSGTIKKIADAAINAIPGGGFLRTALVGGSRRLVSAVIDKMKGLFSIGGGGGGAEGIGGNASPGFPPWPRSPAAQRGNSGVWRKVVALIRSTGPLSGSFGNGYRPGDPKWHGSGRAVDWMGYGQDALATFLARRNPLELIHRTNRRDYAYTRGRNKGSFNNSLMQAHRNHVHVAMRLGGLVNRIAGMFGGGRVGGLTAAGTARLMDRGGRLGSGEIAVNASRHDEHVLTGGPRGDIDRLVAAVEESNDLNRRILGALLGVGGDVATALSGNMGLALQSGRAYGRPR